MTNIEIALAPDYELNGSITNFEAYMFATTDKHISKHFDFDEEIVIVNGNRSIQTIKMNELSDRKSAITLFNKLAKAKIPSIPKPNGLACICIDFVNKHDCDDDEFNEPYAEIKDAFIKFMQDNDRVAVMVQHFYQNERYPHVHILHERHRGEHNIFQEYLITTT